MGHATLIDRLRDRAARLTVIGQGYVGLPLGTAFARAGFPVTGLDADPERVAALEAGRSHSPDVDSRDVAALLESGRYVPTGDAAVLGESDVVVICVPTPLRKSKDPDISFVVAAAQQVAARFRPDQLVVLESTTYPGTTEELLLPMFQARGAEVGKSLFLAFSPERIDPGNPTYRVGDIPKVVGGVTAACTRAAALLHRHIVPRVVEVSSPKVAELAKLYENVFRNVNIALANEFALMCRRLGVSSQEVTDAAATKPFGFLPFHPGPGIGGHCIGIDPFYLAWKMRLGGYEARFIHLADEINRAMPACVVDLVAEALNRRRRCLNGAAILALGVAYKRGVGDIRESPALEVIARLLERGARVEYADPHVPEIALDGGAMKAVEATDERVAGADCVLILTDHPGVDYRRIAETAALVVDTRGATYGLPLPPGRVVALAGESVAMASPGEAGG
jgi:UDP-N-acetyl-D-glucosamine dehydrogenase